MADPDTTVDALPTKFNSPKARIAQRLRIALTRCKSQMEGIGEWDDEQAMFRVGDVRALIEAIEGKKP